MKARWQACFSGNVGVFLNSTRLWMAVAAVVSGLWPTGLVAQELVAQGKGFVVKREELDQLVVEQKVMLQGRGQRISAEQEARIESLTLDRLIGRKLLSLRGTEEDKRKARELVEKGIAEQKGRLGSEEAYRRHILAMGGTVEDYEGRLLEQAVADQVVIRELGSKVAITEEAVREFYDHGIDLTAREVRSLAKRLEVNDKETSFYRDATNRLELIRKTHLDRLVRPAEARARVLVLYTQDLGTGKALSAEVVKQKRDKVDALRRRALEGEDFGAIATKESEEPAAAANKGEYVAWETKVAPELKDVMFASPLKQISEVIVGEKGLYVVQVLERRAGGKVPYEEAKADIRSLLERQEVELRLPGWLEELKKEASVQVLLKPRK